MYYLPLALVTLPLSSEAAVADVLSILERSQVAETCLQPSVLRWLFCAQRRITGSFLLFSVVRSHMHMSTGLLVSHHLLTHTLPPVLFIPLIHACAKLELKTKCAT